MKISLETDVPTKHEARVALQQLPSVTHAVFSELQACAPDWDEFRGALEFQLRNRPWEEQCHSEITTNSSRCNGPCEK
jgi:hypothetical protein